MAEIRLEGVVKRFGKVVAVDHVDLSIKDGEFFVLLGPSGCGKTTTLRLIAGLEYPDEGRILIDGEDVTFKDPKDRNVAMVFQNYALYPHMSVFDNIAFTLHLRRKEMGLTKDDIRRRVIEVAKLLRIEDLLDRKPGQLSGGQQQRVALARALVRRPKVWLMDEPLSNLDALLRLAMRAELKKLQKDLKITTVYVTHDQAEAMSMADRIAVMNKGRVVQVGTPEEVYMRPKHTFVATFIGAPPMNLVECDVESVGEDLWISCPGFSRRVPEEARSVIESKGVRKIYLGIRPEFISVSRRETEGSIAGKVYVVEPLGSEYVVNVDIGDGIIIKAKVLGLREKMTPGDKVYLKLDWSKVKIFDYRTGEALA
ncbi:ABC transporter, ATP binding protein [Aeropyrum pernix K1]|uniref:ABC transporter, ATP binding protein n=1 Tax=Aeropyrum pernix (strain ATCC 700893 / DSM 11879 / JCM 9820 / NBRC 100138 / K1) TaxID=272557 RepID=Q9YG58_AERPE|nr:ABC transporter ATP-binding protein [Aeropyrum pernix]BAA78952.2 ABC transporter, ATP binding protein [Aeropyrum pernix K1]